MRFRKFLLWAFRELTQRGWNNNQAAHDGFDNENKHQISDCADRMETRRRNVKNEAQTENQSIRKYFLSDGFLAADGEK